MKIYLLSKQIPELANLSRPERRKVWRHCHWKMYGFWQFWVGLSVLLVSMILGDVLRDTLPDCFGFPATLSAACAWICRLIGALIYGWIFCTAVIERLRPCLRECIAAHQTSG